MGQEFPSIGNLQATITIAWNSKRLFFQDQLTQHLIGHYLIKLKIFEVVGNIK